MYKLILDTSQANTIIALAQENQLLGSCVILHHNKISSLLIPSIQNFLEKHNISLEKLTAIAVGIGPGSYTGTRVAVSVAKALCLGLEIPLIPFHSLLAYVPDEFEGPFAILLETKQPNPYFLQAIATKEGFEEIKYGIAQEKISENTPLLAACQISLKAAHKDYTDIQINQAGTGLYRLVSHLQEKTFDAIDYDKLDTLELLYIQSIPIASISPEVIPLSNS